MLAGLLAALTGCRCTSCYSEKKVADYPLDNLVGEVSQPASFDIPGTFADNTVHRWFFNGSLIDSNAADALGITGYESPHLQIKSVTLQNCGFYTYSNQNDSRGKFGHRSSATAQLLVAVHPETRLRAMATTASAAASATVVYGTPVAGSGGSGTTCPGPYKGYVNYSGSWKFPKGGQALDGNSAGNPVVYYGVPFTNMGCGSVPPSSYPYHFYIYFKGAVPSGPYPLKLEPNP